MPRFSASQYFRFKIRELWQSKGSKLSEEEFYQNKMKEFFDQIDAEIFKIQHGDFSEMTTDQMLDKVDEIFGIEREQNYPLN